MENKQEFVELIAGCLDEVSFSDINMETKLDDLDGLDSLATLSMSAAINIKYGVNISGLDIYECDTLNEIYELILKGN